ncbi:MAG: hypothetical protein LBU78_15505 [Microbacterium sp.]|jgi:hypothetical protein|nr:hypothetical protein [Microbacterium sp.]
MRHRIPLPDHLGSRFTVAEAAAAGIGQWRSSTPDLDRPFRGVRTKEAPNTFRTLLLSYAPRMLPKHRCIGWTAIRLWGLPASRRWTVDEKLAIAVPRNAAPPRGPRVKGRRLDVERAQTWRVRGIRCVDPIAALFSVAAELTVDEAVIIVDALLTRADNYPALHPWRPVATVTQIEQRLTEWRSFPGSRTVRAALPLAREGVESPKETETRLMIVEAGLPEPVVQHEVREDRRFIARIDLAYPGLQIAIEYEGDGHRTDQDQWRRDIQRTRDLEDRGWIVIRLTQHDLREGKSSFLARLRNAIASRTA